MYTHNRSRNTAIITAGGTYPRLAIKEATCGAPAGAIEIFGRGYRPAIEAFSRPRAAIILIGHGYDWAEDGWTLGGRQRPVFDWDDLPDHIDAHILLLGTCYAAAHAADAAHRMPTPGLVIHDDPRRDEVFSLDMRYTAAAVATEANYLPDSPTSGDLDRLWQRANRHAGTNVHAYRARRGHRYSDTYRRWTTTVSY